MPLPRVTGARSVLKWPVSFVGGTGLDTARSGANWTITYAFAELPVKAVPDLNNDYIVIQDVVTGLPARITVASAAAGGYSGLEFNTRLAKTANYTLVNADKGKTLALGGSAFFTLTIGAASGFDADFVVRIVNEDSTRAKRISPNGVTSFRLWPKQVCHLFNQNNVWHVEYPARYENHEGLELRVSTTGSDTSDGLSTGTAALLTKQAAVDIIQDEWNTNGGVVNVTDGTYTGTALVAHDGLFVSFVGNATTPANCIINVGAAATCFSVQDHATIAINGFRLQSSGAGSTGLHARQQAIADFLNIEFGTFAGGTQIAAEDGSYASMVGPCALVGDADVMVAAGHAAKVNLEGTITIGSARAYTVFASTSFGGHVRGTTNFSGAGVAGTTGIRFTGIQGGSVNDVNTYPGSSNGFIYGGDPAYGGTATTPFYNFGSLDENTGAYRVAADAYGISAGGTQVAEFRGSGVDIIGTNTNDAATSGWVGEYLEAEVVRASAVSLTTGVAANITALNLTAGDWDVWGQGVFIGGATTTVEYTRVSLSTTSATEVSNTLNRGLAGWNGGTPFDVADLGIRAGPSRFSLSGNTTVFLVGVASFAVSTCSAYGHIAARRVR